MNSKQSRRSDLDDQLNGPRRKTIVRPVARTGRLQTRLAASFAILAVISAVMVTMVLYFNVRNQLLQDARARVRDAASIGSLQVDGDAHATLIYRSQEGGDVYNRLKRVLQNIRDAGVNYRYVYTMRYIDGLMYFIVDAEETEENISHLMDPYYELDTQTTEILSTLSEPFVDAKFYTDRWGTWLTGYAPIFTSDGRLDAVIGMDIDASVVRAETNRVLWISLGILGALIPLVVLAGWQLGKRLAAPIVALTDGAEKITAGDLSHVVQIATRDETSRLAQAFNLMTDRLRGMISGLEDTVAKRTQDVVQRSNYLRAAAEVGRAAASILDTRQLIEQVVEVIRARFDLYYVGLFLLDQAGEYAVLQAGTGEAGKTMLARRHRIRVGEGMIGWSVENRRPRVAMEAAEDAVRLVTDVLPLTRSEAALPLITRGRVLGALTVQSEQSGIFTEEVIAVLQTMADQVALSLDNARLFTESEAALASLQRSYGELSRKAWTELLRSRQTRGYRFDQEGVHPVGETDLAPTDEQDANLFKVPIKIRDQVLGFIEARKPELMGAWNQDEINLITSLVDQLSVALENARLYEETQNRAEREKILADITSKVRATTDVSTIMQTAVLELAAALQVPHGAIRLRTPGGQSGPDGGSADEQ
jgi:GAF domain-containing protein/HAMP domain-containing protein